MNLPIVWSGGVCPQSCADARTPIYHRFSGLLRRHFRWSSRRSPTHFSRAGPVPLEKDSPRRRLHPADRSDGHLDTLWMDRHLRSWRGLRSGAMGCVGHIRHTDSSLKQTSVRMKLAQTHRSARDFLVTRWPVRPGRVSSSSGKRLGAAAGRCRRFRALPRHPPS